MDQEVPFQLVYDSFHDRLFLKTSGPNYTLIAKDFSLETAIDFSREYNFELYDLDTEEIINNVQGG